MTDHEKLRQLSEKNIAYSVTKIWLAARHGAAEKLKDRTYKWDIIEGHYQANDHCFTPIATVVNGQLVTYCDCPDHQPDQPCAHVGLLLWAWIHQRSTFQNKLKQYKPAIPTLAEKQRERPNLQRLSPPTEVERAKLLPILGHLSATEAKQKWMAQAQERWDVNPLSRNALLVLSRKWGLKVSNKSMPKIIAAIIQRLSDTTAVGDVVSQWGVNEQKALTVAIPFACQYKEYLPSHLLARLWSRVPGPGLEALQNAWRTAISWGVLTRYRASHDDYINLEMPMVTAAALPPLPAWLPSRSETLPSHWRVVHHSPGTTIRHLRDFVEACQKIPLHLRPQQQPTETMFPANGVNDWPYSRQTLEAARQVSQSGTKPISFYIPPEPPAIDALSTTILSQAIGMDVQEVDFFYHLLRDDNWLYCGSPVTCSNQINTLLDVDDTDLWTRMARLYWYAPQSSWLEINLLRRLQPNLDLFFQRTGWHAVSSWEQFTTSQLRQRRTLSQLLTLLPQKQWINYDALQSVLKLIWHDPLHGFLSDNFYSRRSTIFNDWYLSNGTQTYPLPWNESTGRLLRIFLEHPLHWLGMVDLAYEGETLCAVKLDMADAFYADLRPLARHVTAMPRIPQQPVTEIDYRYDAPKKQLAISLSRLSLERLKFIVSLVEDLSHTNEEQFMGIIDAKRVSHLFDQRISAEQIRRQWQKVFGAPMPAALWQQLRQWEANYGHWRLYTGNLALLEVTDNIVLRELKASSSLQSLIYAELSPRHVLIPNNKVDRFIDELQKKGYTPKIITKGTGQ